MGQQLDRLQFLLERPDCPALLGLEIENLTIGFVHGADVPHFIELVLGSLFDPSERQPLGSADVRPMFINPASAVLVEKGARPFGVRPGVPKKGPVAASDLLCLHLEDRQLVDAATAAPQAAVQAHAMQPGHPPHFCLYLLIESFKALHRLIHGIVSSQHFLNLTRRSSNRQGK
jgi:hypothetical protein